MQILINDCSDRVPINIPHAIGNVSDDQIQGTVNLPYNFVLSTPRSSANHMVCGSQEHMKKQSWRIRAENHLGQHKVTGKGVSSGMTPRNGSYGL